MKKDIDVKCYELTLTPNYVSDWTFNDALRELIQNGTDQEVLDKENKFQIIYNGKEKTLRLVNQKSVLKINTLLLGRSSKANNEDTVGQFGEGYKIAALVLNRLGKTFTIYNNEKGEIWESRFKNSEKWLEKILAFYVYKHDTDNFNPESKYDILYTDPPWQQGRGGKKAARPNSTGTTVPYETMDVPGIMELHRYVTNELMNEKHNVFMWTIDKYLPQTEEIMSLLGYKLHARLIWDKGNGPAPAYTVRFAHEYLLWFYKKGNIILPDKDKRGAFSTVLRENSKRHHSQKPECAYQMLETFFPQAKKLELFARAERDGWDQWGNEL